MLKKLNEAMDYIEEHLEEDFSLDEVANMFMFPTCTLEKYSLL